MKAKAPRQLPMTAELSESAPTTEAEAVAQLVKDGFTGQEVDPTKLYAAPVQPEVLDLEGYLPHPRRHEETATLHTAASLAAFVAAFKGDGSALYADLEARSIVGVLNGSTKDQPGWNDHLAVLQLRHTPDWLHWAKLDGQLVGQVTFAQHIEDGLDAIVSPPAADMLEIAQSFQANSSVEFKTADRLKDGQRQLTYLETVDARAGQAGTLTIPEIFELALAPFEGCQAYKVEARLRYRIGEGKLAIGYKLVRPDVVLRTTFDDIVAEVEKGTGLTAYRGVAPKR